MVLSSLQARVRTFICIFVAAYASDSWSPSPVSDRFLPEIWIYPAEAAGSWPRTS